MRAAPTLPRAGAAALSASPLPGDGDGFGEAVLSAVMGRRRVGGCGGGGGWGRRSGRVRSIGAEAGQLRAS